MPYCPTQPAVGGRTSELDQEALARNSSRASTGTCAIPSTITYRILRPWTSPRRSFVEMSSRLAASDALRSSSDIGSSLFKTEFMADELNLVLDLDQD